MALATALSIALSPRPAMGQGVPIPNFSDPYYFTCTNLSTFPYGVAAGDVLAGNGDDLVVANGAILARAAGCAADSSIYPGTISILENQGPSAWQNPQGGLVLAQEIAVCTDCAPAEVALADMDLDGDLDIFVSASDRYPEDPGSGSGWGVYVFRQASPGVFNQPIYLPTPGPVRPLAVVADPDDLDSNGYPDIAVVGDGCHDSEITDNGKVWIFWADGAGGYETTPDEYDLQFGPGDELGRGVVAVNFDNSPPSGNKPDLVIPGDNGTFVRMLRNLGNRSFELRALPRPGGGCPNPWDFNGVASGLFDPLLNQDLAFCRFTGAVDIALGNGQGGFTHDCTTQTNCNNGDHYPISAAAACSGPDPIVFDFLADIESNLLNADTFPDLATNALGTTAVALLLGRACPANNTRKFAYGDSPDYVICLDPTGAHGSEPVQLELVDLDNNGKIDVVAVLHEKGPSLVYEIAVVLNQ